MCVRVHVRVRVCMRVRVRVRERERVRVRVRERERVRFSAVGWQGPGAVHAESLRKGALLSAETNTNPCQMFGSVCQVFSNLSRM